jgi:hypothetical protein
VFLSFSNLAFDVSSDIHGTLEGETIVGESIRDTPNLGHYKEPFPMEFPASDLPIYRRGFPGIMINPTTEWTREDWRDLIRRRLGPDNEDLYIYARREAPIPTQEMVRFQNHVSNIRHIGQH